MVRILLIEDNTSLQATISLGIKESILDASTYTALNVQEAIERFKSDYIFDIIICDFNLGSSPTDGLVLYRDFIDENYPGYGRTSTNNYKPYWIFTSGEQEVLKSVSSEPHSTFIAKPYKFETLSSLIIDGLKQLRNTSKIETLEEGMKSNVGTLFSRVEEIDGSIKMLLKSNQEHRELLTKVLDSSSIVSLNTSSILTKLENSPANKTLKEQIREELKPSWEVLGEWVSFLLQKKVLAPLVIGGFLYFAYPALMVLLKVYLSSPK